MHLLFISDIHISEQCPRATELFFNFIRDEAVAADNLYILGDLFDYWLGDDMITPLYREVLTALSELAAKGTEVAFLHGNRDFLLSADCAAANSMELLPELAVLPAAAWKGTALVMHGDTLCSDDVDYQQMRALFRTPSFQQEFLARPPAERQQLLDELRQRIASEGVKAEDITDVNEATVLKTLRIHRANLVIHGHTHRPALHQLEVDGYPAQRAVLGSWDESGNCRCLRLVDGQLSTIDYSAAV